MGAGVASRAGVSAHDLLKEQRAEGGRKEGGGVKEEEESEEEMEEEGTESISSVTLEECDGLRRGRLAVPTFFLPFYKTTERENISSTQQCQGCPFPSFVHFRNKLTSV